MAFIDIPNAEKRDEIVQNYLSTITQVQQRNENEKVSNLTKKRILEKTFEPIVRATEKSTVAITEELKKKKEEEGVEDTLSHYLSLDKKILDNYFGIQRKADGSLVMGKTKVTVNGSKITIGDEMFEATPGLWSLIMLNSPHVYTSDDYTVYRVIAELTDVANNPQNVGNGRPVQTLKYKLLEKLYKEGEEPEGEGMSGYMREQFPGFVPQNIGYGIQFLPGDIQGLLTKLGLLLAEFKAGNYNTRNQIVAILDELKRRKQLTNKKYKEINNLLSKGSGLGWQNPGFIPQMNTAVSRAVLQALNET